MDIPEDPEGETFDKLLTIWHVTPVSLLFKCQSALVS